MMPSTKFQITLPGELASEMKTTAARLQIPLAQLIRETMADRLAELKAASKSKNPLGWMDGLASDLADTDLAARVDEILYK
jgi:hypothetical protein